MRVMVVDAVCGGEIGVLSRTVTAKVKAPEAA
jgi:hypothetical protein